MIMLNVYLFQVHIKHLKLGSLQKPDGGDLTQGLVSMFSAKLVCYIC